MFRREAADSSDETSWKLIAKRVTAAAAAAAAENDVVGSVRDRIVFNWTQNESIFVKHVYTCTSCDIVKYDFR